MKKLILILATLSSLQSFAYSGPKLIVNSTGPKFTCEVYDDKVVVTRKIGEVTFTKTTDYKIEGLDGLIEKAYLKGPMIQKVSDYSAVYLTRNITTNALEARLFNFEYNESDFANKLIYLSTTLCDRRNM